jgi:hypothetical protein
LRADVQPLENNRRLTSSAAPAARARSAIAELVERHELQKDVARNPVVNPAGKRHNLQRLQRDHANQGARQVFGVELVDRAVVARVDDVPLFRAGSQLAALAQ